MRRLASLASHASIALLCLAAASAEAGYGPAPGIPLDASGNAVAPAAVRAKVLTPYDSATVTLPLGVVSEANSQIIDIGGNDVRVGTVVNSASYNDGFLRVDLRAGNPLFQFYGGGSGGGAIQVASIDKAGSFVATSLKGAKNTADDGSGNSTVAGNQSLAGHAIASGAAPVVSACGGTPSIAGSDNAGLVTTGTGATSCTVTFAVAYAKRPVCAVAGEGAAVTYSVSATALTIAAGAGVNIDYTCVAQAGG